MDHFVVKHDLESFKEQPGCVWRSSTNEEPTAIPKGFGMIRKGDRWIAFATEVRHVVGFYECVEEATYRAGEGWFIKGEPQGEQPMDTVETPYEDFLHKPPFTRDTVWRILEDEYEAIRKYVVATDLVRS